MDPTHVPKGTLIDSLLFTAMMMDIMNILIAQGAQQEHALEGTRWFIEEIRSINSNFRRARIARWDGRRLDLKEFNLPCNPL